MAPASRRLQSSRDLSAEFYDLDKPEAPPDVLDAYGTETVRVGSPELEAMCGSGRFLLPLLRRDLDMPRRYRFLFVASLSFNLIPVEEALASLRRLREQLRPRGELNIELCSRELPTARSGSAFADQVGLFWMDISKAAPVGPGQVAEMIRHALDGSGESLGLAPQVLSQDLSMDTDCPKRWPRRAPLPRVSCCVSPSLPYRSPVCCCGVPSSFSSAT